MVTAIRPGPDPAFELYPFQREGVDFLAKRDSALLADDMGLGKTAQIIVACEQRGFSRVLIVCPKSVVGVWEREIARWSSLTVCRIEGGPSEREVLLKNVSTTFTVINYELLHRSRDLLRLTSWDALIADEAHRLKNRQAQVTKAAWYIRRPGMAVYLLTGTPIINRPEEIWALLKLLFPTIYKSFWRFVEEHCNIVYNGFAWVPVGLKSVDRFRKLLQPFTLRRLKSRVLSDLPPKTVQQLWLPLTSSTRRVYDSLVKEFFAELDDGQIIAPVTALARLTRLRQVCIHPQVMAEDDGVWKLSGTKFDGVCEILEASEGQSVVVFSQSLRTITALSRGLTAKGFEHGIVSGDVQGQARDEVIDQFQARKIPTLLATTQTGGVGITLTAASIAIFLDKLWAPAYNLQAQDRLHRLGQDQPVTIIELLASGTVEEKIEKILQAKESLVDSVIDWLAVYSEILEASR